MVYFWQMYGDGKSLPSKLALAKVSFQQKYRPNKLVFIFKHLETRYVFRVFR